KKGDPDFYAPMGTPLHVFRKRLSDFPRQAFLKADADRTASFAARLPKNGAIVGLCWRSMAMGPSRRKYYGTIEDWAPILTTPGVTFVNLQYGDCRAELALAREKFGVAIQSFEDLDLKDDIDGAAALSAACDLVISAPTAAAALAGSLGVKT